MEQIVLEETYGKLLLSELFTSVWCGKWDNYEEIISQIPHELLEELPFHKHYERRETALWYDNYFEIPGAYFIPPYVSSYNGESEEAQEQARQDVLCLIGEYEKFGFYYPLEQDKFPDHLGSVTAFITAAIKEEVKVGQAEVIDSELVEQLKELQHHIYTTYMEKGIISMLKQTESRITDGFFQTFLPFYAHSMKAIVNQNEL